MNYQKKEENLCFRKIESNDDHEEEGDVEADIVLLDNEVDSNGLNRC